MNGKRLSTIGRVLAIAAAFSIPIAVQEARGQSYPSKPVRVLVALTPGSGTDTLVRTIAGHLSTKWRQPVVIENRPGGAGAVAGSALVKAEPDGHTLMAYSDGHAVNAALNAANLPYDTLRDIARVCQLATFSTVLVAAPGLGATSTRELVAKAKARPGELSYASAGVGGGLHLSGAMFNLAAGIEGIHVPYKGPQEALTDTVSGRIHYMFSPVGMALPFIESGKLVALAVGSSQRSPLLPNLPTLAEDALAGFDYELWAGLFAPAGTPAVVLDQISRDVASVMALAEVRERLVKLGFVYRPNTPEQFDKLVRSEVERIGSVARQTGIKLQ
jgi:tripartite-type tricarboxylate transporter receptor subunit TctC